MNRNQIPIVYVLLAVLLLCACVPTPEVEPVPNKGDNIMEQVVHTTPIPDETSEQGFVVPDFSAPPHWTESMDIQGTRVEIDADIVYENTAHPVYRIKEETQFDGKTLKALMDLFVSPTKWRAVDSTRAELIADLQRAIRGMDTGETDPETGEPIYASYDGQQEEINRIMAALQAISPEEEWTDIENLPLGEGIVSDEKRKAYYASDGLLFTMRESRDIQIRTALLMEQIQEFRNETLSLPEPSMTKERAIELAEDCLKEVGLDERLSISYVTKAYTVYNNPETGHYEYVGSGWQIGCMTKTEGAKMFHPTFYDYNGGPINTSAEAVAFRPKRRSELLTLYFEDDIIKEITWVYPQTLLSVENPAVTLLPFTDIQTRIRDRLTYGLSWLEGRPLHQTIFVKEIALTYLPAERANDGYTYYWSPMWAVVYECDNMAPVLPFIFFINAIDGSFVSFSG